MAKSSPKRVASSNGPIASDLRPRDSELPVAAMDDLTSLSDSALLSGAIRCDQAGRAGLYPRPAGVLAAEDVRALVRVTGSGLIRPARYRRWFALRAGGFANGPH